MLRAKLQLVTKRSDLVTITPLEKRLRVVADLVRGMDLVTLMGREHAMNQVLVLLRREALGLEPPVAAEDLASLSNAMTELEHEVGRTVPSPSNFNQHAEIAMVAIRGTSSLLVEGLRDTP